MTERELVREASMSREDGAHATTAVAGPGGGKTTPAASFMGMGLARVRVLARTD
jgi:hypothetical protein